MTLARIIVTGITGFVGTSLGSVLRSRGYPIRVAVRTRPAPATSDDVVQIGEIDDRTDWTKALAGGDIVIHLANLAHLRPGQASREQIHRVNVGGTRRLAEQAVDAGVRRLVYVSSVKVNGEETENRPFDGTEAPCPQDEYARSKLAAEQALAEVSKHTGLEIVILRPPLVYGPDVKGNFLSLMRWIDQGRPLPFSRIANRRSLIFVGNLAGAILQCIDATRAAGKTYVVCDGPPVSTLRLSNALAAALKKRPMLFPFPPRLLELAGTVVGRGDSVKRLTRSLELDDHAIRRELGWRPTYSFGEGIRRTADWYRHLYPRSGE